MKPHNQSIYFRFFFKLITSVIIFIISASFTHVFATAGINRTINFQGKIVYKTGKTNIPDGPYDFVFKLYDAASNGNQLPTGTPWTESWTGGNQITVTNGVFRVALGSLTTLPATLNFNDDSIYLDITFNSEAFTTRVRLTAVPYAFNAEKVSGLTVTSTTGTLTIPNTKTISFADAFTTSGANALTLTTTNTTNVTLPTTGTLLTNTASANQTITSTQTSGTLFSLADSTGLSGAIIGQEITLSGTGAQDQTGLKFNLSNASGTNLNDIVGTDSSWKVSKAGVLTVSSCTGCGGGGGPWTDGTGVTYLTDTAEKVAIGTTTADSMLEVGSQTNRGDITMHGDLYKDGIIKQTGLANINDVFIYDTTTDSNQGAWRNSLTSQQLSWYTETKDHTGVACVIGSDDRCGESYFPRKAILVTTNDALYIFNQKDSTLWMKFTQGGTYTFGADSNNNPSGVFAINGVIYVGTNGSSGTGLYAIDFVTDRLYNIDTTDRSQGDKNIANRNTTVTYNTDNNTKYAILNNLVNDVHGTVIQGSTYTTNTSSPMYGVIIIAVATDAGVSAVNLNRPIVYSYSEATGDDYNAVYITKRGWIYALNETQAQLEKWFYIDSNYASETNGTPDRIWDQTAGIDAGTSRTHGVALVGLAAAPTIQVSPDTIEVTERTSASDDAGDTIYVGTDKGLSVIHTNITNENLGFSKFYTKDYITDLQYGGVRAMIPFHNASGDITDVSYKNNVMEPNGSPTYASTDGVRGTSMLFDNSTSVLCSDSDNNATCDQDTDFDMGTPGANTGFFVSAWFKHSSSAPASGVDMLIDHSTAIITSFVRDSAGWAIWMNTSGYIVAGWDDDTTQTSNLPTDIQLTNSVSYADNQWHHVVAAQLAAADRRLFIDGKQVGRSTTSVTGTFTVSNVGLLIGGDCTATNCTGVAQVWDGRIDDVVIGSDNGVLAASTYLSTEASVQRLVRRMFLEGNSALMRKTISVADATAGEVSSTTIGDSAETWVPNEFVGSFVEIYGGTGIGQTRRIVSNTTTTMTVYPAWTVTPDTTSDFQVYPEELYGATDTVRAIGIQDSFIGEHRKLYIGTNDTSDGGGVTVFNNVGANHVTDLYHNDAKKLDDSSSEWTGTDSDDVQAIADTNGVIAFGSLADFWQETEDTSLQQTDDLMGSYVQAIRLELRADGLNALTPEQAYIPGADLAENYYSNEFLDKGEVVSLVASQTAYINKSTKSYDRNVLGIVATSPGIVLGESSDLAYPIALVGRVPVKVTTENGIIKAGDYITSSSVPGHAMKAIKAGRVLGKALEDLDLEKLTTCIDNENLQCGTILVFVNLSDFLGEPVEFAMNQESGVEGISTTLENNLLYEKYMSMVQVGVSEKDARILAFLNELKEKQASSSAYSEVFADRITAAGSIISPEIITNTLFAKTIKAEKIEGLEIFTNKINSLSQAMLDLQKEKGATNEANIISQETDGTVLSSQTENLDMDITGKILAKGGLSVEKESLFKGDSIFEKLVSFISDTLFKGNVIFEKIPTFNKDTAGFAKIKQGSRFVEIKYDEEYKNEPVIVATLLLPKLTQETYEKAITRGDCVLPITIEQCQEKVTNDIFSNNFKYIITQKTNKGFIIQIDNYLPIDITFSWLAFAVKDPKLFESLDINAKEQIITPMLLEPTKIIESETQPTLVPTFIPSPTLIPQVEN